MIVLGVWDLSGFRSPGKVAGIVNQRLGLQYTVASL